MLPTEPEHNFLASARFLLTTCFDNDMSLNYSANDPLLNDESVIDLDSLTLGEYLQKYEARGGYTDCIFLLGGGLHYSSSDPANRWIVSWRYFLYILAAIFLLSSILLLVLYSDVWYMFVPYMAQVIILVPVVMNSSTRMNDSMTKSHAACFESSLKASKGYVCIAVTCSTIYLIISALLADMINYDIHVMLYVFTGVVCLYSIALLNVWAIFFLILDAKVSQLEIRGLIDQAKDQTLDMNAYDMVQHKLRYVNANSSNIADGIALVTYMCVIGIVLSFFLYKTTEALSGDFGGAQAQLYSTSTGHWLVP